MSRRFLWIAMWVASIVATAAYVRAQRTLPANPVNFPMMVTGNDVAFRITGYGTDTAQGRLLVRVNGVWQETELLPATSGK